MTSTPPPGTPGSEPPPSATQPEGATPTDRLFASLRSVDLRRGEDRWLAGVCSGLAHRLGVDPAIVRVAFVLLALLAGFGIGLYLLGWLLVPEHDQPPHLERGVRGGEAGSIVLLVITAIVVLGNLPWWDAWEGGWWAVTGWLLWVSVVVLAVWAGVRMLSRRRSTQPAAGPASGAQPPPPPPAAGAITTTPAPPPGATASPAAATGAPSVPPPGGDPPAPPVRERRRGPGAALSLLVTGLALATLGTLWWAALSQDWPGNPFTVAVAATLALLGVVLLALGLTGRRAGATGVLAVLALLVSLLAAPAPDDYRPSTRFGEETWRPSASALTGTAQSEPLAYRHGLGVAVLDLRGLEAADLPPGAELHAWVDVGQLVVRVPDDLVVDVDGRAGVGAVSRRDTTSDPNAPPRQVTGGLAVTERFVTGSGANDPATTTDLDLRLHVGVGEVSVREDRA